MIFFFGAALGIVSTELGYMFSDLIFKDRDLITYQVRELNNPQKTSFSEVGSQFCFFIVFIPCWIANSLSGNDFHALSGSDFFNPEKMLSRDSIGRTFK